MIVKMHWMTEGLGLVFVIFYINKILGTDSLSERCWTPLLPADGFIGFSFKTKTCPGWVSV